MSNLKTIIDGTEYKYSSIGTVYFKQDHFEQVTKKLSDSYDNLYASIEKNISHAIRTNQSYIVVQLDVIELMIVKEIPELDKTLSKKYVKKIEIEFQRNNSIKILIEEDRDPLINEIAEKFFSEAVEKQPYIKSVNEISNNNSYRVVYNFNWTLRERNNIKGKIRDLQLSKEQYFAELWVQQNSIEIMYFSKNDIYSYWYITAEIDKCIRNMSTTLSAEMDKDSYTRTRKEILAYLDSKYNNNYMYIITFETNPKNHMKIEIKSKASIKMAKKEGRLESLYAPG